MTGFKSANFKIFKDQIQIGVQGRFGKGSHFLLDFFGTLPYISLVFCLDYIFIHTSVIFGIRKVLIFYIELLSNFRVIEHVTFISGTLAVLHNFFNLYEF